MKKYGDTNLLNLILDQIKSDNFDANRSAMEFVHMFFSKRPNTLDHWTLAFV